MQTHAVIRSYQIHRRTRRAAYAGFVVALTFAVAPAQAQNAAADSLLTAGVRVAFRTWATDSAGGKMSRRTDAIVVAHDRATMQVRLLKTHASVVVPIARVARLDVASEPDRHPTVGALVGFLVGGATGYLVGDPCSLTCGGNGPADRGERTQQGVLIGGAIGAVLGGVVGYNITTRSWSRVIPASAAAVRLEPTGDAMAIKLHLTF